MLIGRWRERRPSRQSSANAPSAYGLIAPVHVPRSDDRSRSKSPFVFVSERGTPFSTRGFQAMVERVTRAAGFDMKNSPAHAAA
jgi:site-specific recombinase XerD